MNNQSQRKNAALDFALAEAGEVLPFDAILRQPEVLKEDYHFIHHLPRAADKENAISVIWHLPFYHFSINPLAESLQAGPGLITVFMTLKFGFCLVVLLLRSSSKIISPSWRLE